MHTGWGRVTDTVRTQAVVVVMKGCTDASGAGRGRAYNCFTIVTAGEGIGAVNHELKCKLACKLVLMLAP